MKYYQRILDAVEDANYFAEEYKLRGNPTKTETLKQIRLARRLLLKASYEFLPNRRGGPE